MKKDGFSTIAVRPDTAARIRLVKAMRRDKTTDDTVRWLLERAPDETIKKALDME